MPRFLEVFEDALFGEVGIHIVFFGVLFRQCQQVRSRVFVIMLPRLLFKRPVPFFRKLDRERKGLSVIHHLYYSLYCTTPAMR